MGGQPSTITTTRNNKEKQDKHIGSDDCLPKQPNAAAVAPTKQMECQPPHQPHKSPQSGKKDKVSPGVKLLQKLQRKPRSPSGKLKAGHGDGDAEEAMVSPVTIRQQKLKQLEEDRPQMTQDEMHLILLTWSELQQDMERVGCDVFVRLFETYPEVKGAFGPFRGMSSEDVRLSTELRAHGMRVLRTVGDVLEKHHDIDVVVEHLHELGSKHITFNAKPDYVDMVGQQFLFAIEPVLQDRWTPEVEHAWGKFFRLIGHVMKEAMML